MKAKHATAIRRGILLALIGVDLDYKSEEPLTIEAYLRTSAKERRELPYYLTDQATS